MRLLFIATYVLWFGLLGGTAGRARLLRFAGQELDDELEVHGNPQGIGKPLHEHSL